VADRDPPKWWHLKTFWAQRCPSPIKEIAINGRRSLMEKYQRLVRISSHLRGSLSENISCFSKMND
jgi:hypothetical protein